MSVICFLTEYLSFKFFKVYLKVNFTVWNLLWTFIAKTKPIFYKCQMYLKFYYTWVMKKDQEYNKG